ncbi:hypothetical protein BBP40_007692 [Aspergillus hancockii]|nr:hypothetical protein BBP40_007692 [Aspergillus hancockii]
MTAMLAPITLSVLTAAGSSQMEPVYGWATDPATEWYVVEQHGTGTPGNGHILGQVNVDGGIYDVYKLPYRNVPKIYGVTNFNQLWSVRHNPRTTGSVDVAAHFKSWKDLGLKPG